MTFHSKDNQNTSSFNGNSLPNFNSINTNTNITYNNPFVTEPTVKMDIDKHNKDQIDDDISITLSKEIGYGGSSSICKTTLKNGKTVVIKKFNNDSGIDVLQLGEIDIMARIKHPNIMEFNELRSIKESVGINNYIEKLSILMNLMDYDLFQGGPRIMNKNLYKIFHEVTLALGFLHKNNILHLDIKPQNVLIKYQNGNYDVKLIDMGLSVYVNPNIKYYYDKVKDQDKIISTPKFIPETVLVRNFAKESISLHYRPHEVYHKQIVSDRSDVWSLAILFLEILSGMNITEIVGITEMEILNTLCLLEDEKSRRNLINNCFAKNKERNVSQEYYFMIDKMLVHNFYDRISIDSLLKEYFNNKDINKPIETFNSMNMSKSMDISKESSSELTKSLDFLSQNIIIPQDIFQNMKVVENVINIEFIAHNHYIPNFPTLTGILIIIRYAHELDLLIETVFLGIDLYYRTLKKFKLEHNKYNVHLLAFNCIFIATKIVEDIKKIVSINNLSTLTGGQYSIKQLIDMETSIVIRHSGQLYFENIFHKCKCKHDLINGLNLMCNIFVYPSNPQFIPNQCNICIPSDDVEKEMENYPLTILSIIAESIFVKNQSLMNELQCHELFNRMKQ